MTETEYNPIYMYSSASHNVIHRSYGDLMQFPPSELATFCNQSEHRSLSVDELEVQ